MIRVPMLVPGLEYTFETLVECVSDLGISDQLYVFVTKDEVCEFTSLPCVQNQSDERPTKARVSLHKSAF